LNTKTYIIKTSKEGVKVLTIDDLNSQQFSLKLLLKVDTEDWSTYNDSLQLQITPSDIMIATTQNEKLREGKYKRSIKVMKVKVAKM
jgi:hypothetical protein